MADLDRLKALAGLLESFDDYDPEAAEGDAAMAREQHVTTLIRHAFAKLGLEIDSYSNIAVMYEDSTREATVLLEEQIGGIPLEQLAGLMSSGLGSDYKVRADGDMHVEISFVVDPALDDAFIP